MRFEIPHTKFWIALLTLCMAFGALLGDKLTGGEFVTVALAVVGMYAAANIGATAVHQSGNTASRATVTGRRRSRFGYVDDFPLEHP